jgi:hypothetical protein
MNKILDNSFESMRNLTAEERASYDHYLFGLMRNSTPEEQRLYRKMLNRLSVPFGGSIFNMGDIEVGYCDICHKKAQLQRKYYYYDVNCDCCGSSQGHFEIVKYCDECTPKPPKRINVMMEPYND